MGGRLVKPLTMPQLALGSEDVIVRAWLISPGDAFSAGDALLEVETDKATMEVEAPFDGRLATVACHEGDTVEVGAVIGYAAEPGDDLDAVAAVVAEESPPEPTAEVADHPAAAGAREDAVRETQADRVLDGHAPRFVAVTDGELAGLPVRLTAVERTAPIPAADPQVPVPVSGGPGVVAQDISADLEHAGPADRRPMSRRRLGIARRMTLATAIPTFSVTRDVALTAASAAVESARAGGGAVTVTDVLLRACAVAAKAHPEANAWLSGETVFEFERVGIALAVATPDGVIAPVIREADTLPLQELADLRGRLVERARNGSLGLAELAGATISLSNVGGLGAHQLTPVITVPQVAVLGVGSARASRSGPALSLTFVGDHRALDGAAGAAFLATFAEAFESTSEA
jgi:pyruvate dehydrogenase E2 component (dihydrolipoamide acetyltransferase)